MLTLGIDPGPAESAYCYVTPQQTIDSAGKVANVALIEMLRASASSTASVAIESIQSYGQIVGRSTFDTCYMVGRLIQVCEDLGIPFALYPRPEYARQIAGGSTISDKILRQALCLRFGGDGETVTQEVIPEGEPGAGIYLNGPRKGQPRLRDVRIPEPLHKLVGCSDKRSAFAVAVYHIDRAKIGI